VLQAVNEFLLDPILEGLKKLVAATSPAWTSTRSSSAHAG